MKYLKKAGIIVLATVLLVMANTPPVNVKAESADQAADITGNSNSISYEVKKGDSLWTLAQRFDVSIGAIAAANSLDEDSLLDEGQWLVIPASKVRYYSVKQGDTLWGIARGFGTDAGVLGAANNLASEDTLLVGQVLSIPESGRFPEVGDIASQTGAYVSGLSDLTVWPVSGKVSSEFGPRWGRRHEGLDIAAMEGTPVRALESGTVVFAGKRGTYGNTVIINHGHGFRSLYAHAWTLEVNPGEYVEQGQTIARVGSTGHSTGPHLHLELLYRGKPLDPEKYLPTGEGRI